MQKISNKITQKQLGRIREEILKFKPDTHVVLEYWLAAYQRPQIAGSRSQNRIRYQNLAALKTMVKELAAQGEVRLGSLPESQGWCRPDLRSPEGLSLAFDLGIPIYYATRTKPHEKDKASNNPEGSSPNP